MAMLIGGPEEKYARLGLHYSDMMKLVEIEERLQSLSTLAESGPATSIHRQVQAITDGISTLVAGFRHGMEVATGMQRSFSASMDSLSQALGGAFNLMMGESKSGGPEGVLSYLYFDSRRALSFLSDSLLSLDGKIAGNSRSSTAADAVRDSTAAAGAVYDFRSLTLATVSNLFANRRLEAGIPEDGYRRFDSAEATRSGAALLNKVEEDHRLLLRLQSEWSQILKLI
jgi:hypothetical protein